MPARLAAVFALVASVASVAAQHVWRNAHPAADTTEPAGMNAAGAGATEDLVWITWCNGELGSPGTWLARSTDRGRTFDPPVRVDAGLPPGVSAYTLLAADDDSVAVCWETGIHGWPPARFACRASNDRGATWQPRFRPPPISIPGEIFVHGDSIVLVDRDRFTRSDDLGRTWSTPRRPGPPSSAPFADELHMVQVGSSLHATWFDGAPQAWVGHYNVSFDFGRTWQPANRRWGVILAHDSLVVQSWQQQVGGVDRLFCDRSQDGGRTWLPAPACVSCQIPAMDPTISTPDLVFDGSTLGFLCRRTGQNGYYWVRSSDLGTTWSIGAVPVLTPRSTLRFSIVDVFASAGACHVLYRDSSWSYLVETWRTSSADGGSTWPHVEQLVSWGATSHRFVGAGSWLGVLEERRLSWMPPIYELVYSTRAGLLPLGSGLAGAGAFVPELAVERTPTSGVAIALELRQAIGGAVALVTLGTATAPQPFLSGTLFLAPTALALLPLGGGASVPGAGTAAASLVVPWSPGGASFACQAFVLDPAAPQGVAMSPGYDVRVL